MNVKRAVNPGNETGVNMDCALNIRGRVEE